MLPYQFVLTIGSILCAVGVQFDRRAALWLRLLLLVLEGASFLMPVNVPGQTIAIVLQLTVAMVVLLRREALRS